MAHLCVPQNQALGVCRGFVPDIQVCGTHGRLSSKATITSNAEEGEEKEDYNIYSLKLLSLTLYQYNIHQKRITIIYIKIIYNCNFNG